jgi:mannose-6-phosphate isomerase
MKWYPIKLTTPIRQYYFGERVIPERLGKQGLPAEGKIAETWEISGYRDAMGTVVNGSLAGRTLQQLTTDYPDELVGQGWRGPHFPLLEKFLDASHMLPVHLHADDETALRLHNEPNGKTEAWHILWAAPDATILAGLKSEFTRDELFEAFVAQDYDSVVVRHPIQAGDTIYVPGGIIHSFGPDALVFEVQQTSDLGQFVMPTDLYDRQFDQETWYANINATLDELKNHYHPRPNPGLELQEGANRRTICCAGPYFALERWTLSETYIEPAHPHRCLTLSNVGTPVQLEFEGGTEQLAQGESCILPAAIGEISIIPDRQASLVACYVPDFPRDVIEPLRAAGYSDRQIQELGEVSV